MVNKQSKMQETLIDNPHSTDNLASERLDGTGGQTARDIRELIESIRPLTPHDLRDSSGLKQEVAENESTQTQQTTTTPSTTPPTTPPGNSSRDYDPCFKPFNKTKRLNEFQLNKLSSLFKLIKCGNFSEFMKLLSENGDDFKSFNLLNIYIDGQTALHFALIYNRSLLWCKELISYGANPNLTNRAGWHPIHLAAFNNSRETMLYLIDYLELC